ncbi:MAG: HIT family protein [Gordonia sp. (in: high G+C Gram-positive bacteria)]|uniref:HIT family protein n=1 Tax=Gordonia sp. (in: high G+C Gram-positive bacteria) TaxID=84139 RepID=UPI003BB4BD07
MTDCIFCAIADGRAPARIVYSDEHIVGFLDIRPITAGHTLLVPREHSVGLADLPAATGARLFAAGQKVAAAAKIALGADGVNLALNDGKSAFQTVFHTHLHVIPRHSGDKLAVAKGFLTRRAGDQEAVAAALRAELDGTTP